LPDDYDLKYRVAREAATLLYFGAEKEYKQAKTKAAQTFGVHFLPSNLEIALELDKISEENEGAKRKERFGCDAAPGRVLSCFDWERLAWNH
jgi:predicted nucleotidyltransferase